MIRAAALPAAALAATPALAGFGAIAYAPETGAWGVGRGETRAAAEDAARATCETYGGACLAAATFEGDCGALARGDAASTYGAASAATLADAETRAAAACARLGAGCAIEVSLCADR